MRGTTRLGSAEAGTGVADLRKGKATYCNSSRQKNTHILCSGCLIYVLIGSRWLLRYSLTSFCDPKHCERKTLRAMSDNRAVDGWASVSSMRTSVRVFKVARNVMEKVDRIRVCIDTRMSTVSGIELLWNITSPGQRASEKRSSVHIISFKIAYKLSPHSIYKEQSSMTDSVVRQTM